MADNRRKLDASDITTRLPLWKALSELFLDTELDDSDFKYIAHQVLRSNFSPREVNDILWNEVFPALGDNLRIVAGEWSGFRDRWLEERIVKVMSGVESGLVGYGLITVRQTREIVAEAWHRVCEHLPEAYRRAQDNGWERIS